uniref:Uncharacterized protein n=1 Tax=Oryza sativa subsp. japonica TaxID=39947 RepID=Q6EQA8_ORYSJ|nr:hypothetical protein [Oryza sativa Japonica Group]BAD29162.1 hypothetical protein [Oryza sativa Japonica Group]
MAQPIDLGESPQGRNSPLGFLTVGFGTLAKSIPSGRGFLPRHLRLRGLLTGPCPTKHAPFAVYLQRKHDIGRTSSIDEDAPNFKTSHFYRNDQRVLVREKNSFGIFWSEGYWL